MDTPLNYYDHVLEAYIRAIRRDSVDAANTIEQIHVSFGSRAALRAALVIALVKIDAVQNKPVPDSASFAYMLEPFLEAMLMLDHALTCWLRDWKILHPVGL